LSIFFLVNMPIWLLAALSLSSAFPSPPSTFPFFPSLVVSLLPAFLHLFLVLFLLKRHIFCSSRSPTLFLKHPLVFIKAHILLSPFSINLPALDFLFQRHHHRDSLSHTLSHSLTHSLTPFSFHESILTGQSRKHTSTVPLTHFLSLRNR
jgi:hypothetical protein